MDGESAEAFIARKSRQWETERRAIKAKDIGRRGWALWTREAWTWHVQTNYAEKVLLIERLRLTERVGETAYSPLIPQRDFDALFAKARAESTILPSV
jgi:hypothetical protein